MRRQAEPVGADTSVPMVVVPKLAPTEATRRWAALLRQIDEVDPLVCPRCAGPMRRVACITQAAVIDQILTHLRTRATASARRGARSPPATAARGARRHLPARPASLHAPWVPDCRPPAHWSGPRGVPVRPASSPRQATTTRRGADRTTERAGGRATAPSWTARGRVADGRPLPPGPHAGAWHGVKRRAILPRTRLEILSRTTSYPAYIQRAFLLAGVVIFRGFHLKGNLHSASAART
jgi:hypothetical protein